MLNAGSQNSREATAEDTGEGKMACGPSNVKRDTQSTARGIRQRDKMRNIHRTVAEGKKACMWLHIHLWA